MNLEIYRYVVFVYLPNGPSSLSLWGPGVVAKGETVGSTGAATPDPR